MADCLNLLHFHLGSQITNIRQIKGAVNEAVRVYVELARAGAGLKYLDVGGGLGIDYDGSQTDFESSVNYTLQEYANDVIYHVQERVRRSRGAASRRSLRRAGGRSWRITACWCSTSWACPGWAIAMFRRSSPPDAEQPLIDLAETYRGSDSEEPARKLSRRAAGAGPGAESVQPGLSFARAALHRGESLLGDSAASIQRLARRAGLFPGGAGRPRRDALRHLLLQLLALPEHAG